MSVNNYFFVIVFFLLAIQACSNSDDTSKQQSNSDAAALNVPIGEIKSIGNLIKDESGSSSLSHTGVKWEDVKTNISADEFSKAAYKNGCLVEGQPEVKAQLDKLLSVGQIFLDLKNEMGQDYHFLLTTNIKVKSIDSKYSSIILDHNLVESADSRLAQYKGAIIESNPYLTTEVKIAQSELTGLPIDESRVVESHFHQDWKSLIQLNVKSTKIDCHLLKNENQTESLSLGRIKLKNNKMIAATKIVTQYSGEVVCERSDYSLVFDQDSFFKRGPSHQIGKGKYINVQIFSNDIPSLSFSHCGGATVLDLKLLVLDDGRVIQQKNWALSM